MPSRREFVEGAALSAIGMALPTTDTARLTPTPAARRSAPAGFLDIARVPDRVAVQTATGIHALRRESEGRWTDDRGIAITTAPHDGVLRISLASPTVELRRLQLRWRGDLRRVRLIVGDAWERGYGDLEWRSWVPDRAMPWYFATNDGSNTHAYGVRTSPRALCFWQADHDGISLCADVRSGGAPLRLGERTLDVCDVTCRAGHDGESAFAALRDFCRQMCPRPRLPSQPVYGSNDWYWAYGNNSADSVRADAQHVAELSPNAANRPFAVIDDGWQPGRGASSAGAGSWDRGNEKFPDVPGLVADMRSAGARAGIWIRPLQAPADVPDSWCLPPRSRNILDPTVPEVQQKVAADLARLRTWGFELIKHDYTTYDVFGHWGFQMGTQLTRDGWTFAAGPSRTTAEVIDALYRTIRTAAGDAVIIGCNTVSHLSAGVFELCRVGDDTSGAEWARTRKMGVNTLGFRGVQHGAFYVADADCVGVTKAVPWSLTRQWLDLVARSGTTTFVSLAPDALGADQRRDLREALAIAATPQPLAEPLDWLETVYPERWRLMGRERAYAWVGSDGVDFPGDG